MKKIIFVVVAICIFSCKNASEKTDPNFDEAEVDAKEELISENENYKKIATSLLFPFDMDLSTFIKEPLKIGANQGDCSKSFQRYTKNEIEVSIDTFDCDIWGFNTYSFLINNGKLIRANHKSGENLSNNETDFAARILTERVYDFSAQPYMQYVRTDTIKDFETKILQSNFKKSEIKDSEIAHTKLMSQYSENQDIIIGHDGSLILTENNLGALALEKGKAIDVYSLRETFVDFEVSENIGEQDGPDYFYYTVGEDLSITTADTENQNLSQIWIKEGSTVPDIYGAKVGMTYYELIEKRPNLSISTEHYHVYLYEEGSHIVYEMSLGDYSGPDKKAYTFEEIKNGQVIEIIWK